MVVRSRPSPPKSNAASIRERLVLAALLAVFCAQSVGEMWMLTATSDETSHLPAGYTYLRTGDLRLNPQHPPLVKELCALPLLALKPKLDLTHPRWQPETLNEWIFGYDFLYTNDADRLLFWGRLPVVAIAILLGWYLWRWAREMFGPPAAWTALGLYCFSPNVIAHSHLVTMDLPLACFSFVSLYYLWRYVHHGLRRDLAGCGIGLGLALASKFSAVLFLPVIVALLGLTVIVGTTSGERTERRGSRREPAVRSWGRDVRRMAVAGGVILVLAAAVVYVVYQCPTDPLFYWHGLRKVNQDHRPDHASFLLGQFKIGGWWYYFLVAFAVKTPLPTLLLLVGALLAVRRHPAGGWLGGPNRYSDRLLDEAFIALPVIGFTAATSALADNLGIRYLIPVYPLLFLFASRVGLVFARSRRWAAVAVALGVWYAGSAAYTYPEYLSYFNEAVGGPSRGYRYLDDSNIDWGGGLRKLKAYLEHHGIGRIHLLYGWNGSPSYYGIPYDRVTDEQWSSRPRSGVWVMSTHMLIRGEYHARRLGVPTNWLTLYHPVDHIGYSFYVFRFD